MYHRKRSNKKKELVLRTLLYTSMSLLVLALVSFIIFSMLGYRFNLTEGTIERGGLVQFGSTPSGARVSVDGTLISTRTPGKASVLEGARSFTISMDGYKAWSKTLDIKSGTLTWLNYTLLIPNSLSVEVVGNLDSVHSVLASPNRQSLLIHSSSVSPAFRVYDIRSTNVTFDTIVIPAALYAGSGNPGSSHTFKAQSWATGGRYVLVEHTYREASEWLVLDTQNAQNTKNLNRIFGVEFNDIKFADSNGSLMYTENNGVLRQLNLSNETISRQLVSGVKDFDTYGGHIVTYTAIETKDDITRQVIGVYRDGDEDAYTIQSFVDGTNPRIATAHYFNDDYVAVAYGRNVRVLSGNYPDSKSGINNLKAFAEFELEWDVASISFSPSGQYVFMESGNGNFASYDLEYNNLASLNIEGEGAGAIDWLNNNYLWSIVDGQLVIREFDGTNISTINSAVSGHDVVLTSNSRFIYSIGYSDEEGLFLQRVSLVITN
jgi:hypothetical protein